MQDDKDNDEDEEETDRVAWIGLEGGWMNWKVGGVGKLGLDWRGNKGHDGRVICAGIPLLADSWL